VSWYDVDRHGEEIKLHDSGSARPIELDVDGSKRKLVIDPWHHKIGSKPKPFPLWKAWDSQEWLIPSSADPAVPAPDIDGVPVFQTREEAWTWLRHGLKQAWWKNDPQELALVEERAGAFVDLIERGLSPRRPGEQCTFCPARDSCMGLEAPREILSEEVQARTATVPSVAPIDGPVDLDKLAEQPRNILERVTEGGLTVVSAGAGSGKTYTMVATVMDQLINHGHHVDDFVLVTFTNAAADELRIRLENAISAEYRAAQTSDERRRWLVEQERIAAAQVGTIHSFCATILLEFGYGCGVPRSANRTVSNHELTASMEEVLHAAFSGDTSLDQSDLGAGEEPIVARIKRDSYELADRLIDLVNQCHGIGVEIPQMRAATQSQATDDGKIYRQALADIVSDAAALYSDRKRQEGIVDPHDLLLRTKNLLASDRGDSVVDTLAERFRFLFVDEFQDTDPIQAAIVKKLQPRLEAVLLVGDLKQSIYGFRDAKPNLLKEFADEYHRREGETGHPLPLSVARRPTQQLLKLQNEFFAGLRGRGFEELAEPMEPSDQPLEPKHPLVPLIVDPTTGKQGDSATMADYIRGYLGTKLETKDGVRQIVPGDIAILERSNAGVRRHQAELNVQLAGEAQVLDDTGGLFYSRPEVVSTYRMLRVLLEPESDVALALALETPYLRHVDLTEAETDLIEDAGSDGRLTARFQEDHGEVAERLGELRKAMREDSVPHVMTQLYEVFEIREFFASIGHRRGVENLEKLRESARVLFGQEQALTMRIYVDRLNMAIAQRWREDDANVALGGDEPPPYVRIMTIHQAKGREFPIVIIPGIGRWLVDSQRDPAFVIHKDGALDVNLPTIDGTVTKSPGYENFMRSETDEIIDEEMRLLYVAVTRAEHAVVALGAWPGNYVGKGEEGHSWRDEILAAQDRLEPLGAEYRSAAGPPSDLTL
jgi:DNA helicase-2/ATP-dependent DNA helicase PcrA